MKVEFITVGLQNVKIKTIERINQITKIQKQEIMGNQVCRKEEENIAQERRQKRIVKNMIKKEVENRNSRCSFSH